MLKFLTIFPKTSNVHLIKDVGMIPYVLHKEYGYDSFLLSFENGHYPYIETDVKGLKHLFISRKFNNEILDVCWYILLNFRKYDIVQCYHISKESIIYLLFFKLLKLITFSKHVTYLKFDANDSIKNIGLSKKLIYILKKINILSIETKTLYNYLNSENLFNGVLNYIPNGYYNSKTKVKFSSKENIILTVGRIGSKEKNNEVLLKSFKDFAKNNKDWKLELVGPIDNGFKQYINDYFEENPGLVSRVIFTGNITDRDLLQTKYDKAKIFALTSPMEAFPLVFLEAIKSGCTLISPSFSSAIDVTSDGELGVLFEVGNYDSLTRQITEMVNNSAKLEYNCEKIQDYAYDNFYWKKICGNLNEIILRELN